MRNSAAPNVGYIRVGFSAEFQTLARIFAHSSLIFIGSGIVQKFVLDFWPHLPLTYCRS